jgi:hypothetical protein
MSTVTAREHAHELIDRLEQPQAEAVVRFLESMVNGKLSADVPKKRHRQEESEWMATHQEELNSHRGEWVVIEGRGIVAAAADHDTAWRQAKALGIEVPLLFQVWENDLPFAGF